MDTEADQDTITVFRNLNKILIWNEEYSSHTYISNGDLVIKNETIVQVGGTYTGLYKKEVNGENLMAIPGMIDMHSHPTSEPGNRGLLEELGSPKLGQSSLYEFMPVFRSDISNAAFSTQVAVSEMLKSGVSTCVDLSYPRSGWADDLAGTGIRGVLAPMFRSGTWRTSNGYSVDYVWDEKAGEKGLEDALDVCYEALKHPSKRLSCMLAPAQIDTCTENLLKNANLEAKRLNIRTQIHAAQSIVEFNEITHRYGVTPIEWLHELGLLNNNTIIGHGIFLNDHKSVFWPEAEDFKLLSDSDASIAHCPTIFMRRGIALNYFNRYRRAGILLGIGTDTFPHNIIEEMRMACYAARLTARNFKAMSTADAFNAVTIDAAKILGRTDIGRLSVGCKADFSLIDLKNPYMRPAREPLRSLIYSAGDRAIKDVYINGVQVVDDKNPIYIDFERAACAVEKAQYFTLSNVHKFDYAGRTAETLSPMVYPDHT
jgi:cytosine/adenosine deaminase-related metal-dependent hydrolase